MPYTIVTTQTILARNAGALYGLALSSNFMSSLVSQAGTTVASQEAFLNTVYVNSVGQAAPGTVATELATGMGFTDLSAGSIGEAVVNYIAGQLSGVAYTARGATINTILNLFSTLSEDPSLGTFAASYNIKVANAEAYALVSSNTSNATYATLSAVVAGSTFVLTTGVDSKSGTTSNDFFDGSTNSSGNATWSSNDTIAGGAGTDTLSASIGASNISTGNITGVEKFEITATDAATINMAGTSGYTNLTSTGSSSTLAFNNIASTATAGAVRNTTVGATTFNFKDAGLSAVSDTFAVTVEGSDTGVTLSKTTGTNTLETIAITTENADATIANLVITDLGATKITVAGDKDLTVTTLTDNTTAGATVVNIDASAATGNVTIASNAVTGVLSMTGGAGNDVLTANGVAGTSLAGGAGNDTIRIGVADTQWDANDTISGGAGNDTVQAEADSTVVDANFTNVTSVEKLASGSTALDRLTATLGALAKAAGIVSVVGGTGVDDITFQSAYDATTVDVNLGGGDDGVNNNDDTVTVDGTTATLIVRATEAELTADDNLTGGSGTNDELIVKGDSSLATLDGSFLAIEKITIANDVAAVNLSLTDNASIASGKNMTVNAAAMTSGSFGLTFSMENETNGKVSVTGGAGGDAITLNTTSTADTSGASVNGGAGNDTITMSSEAFTSADTLVGGAGNDTITIDAAAAAAATVVDADFTNVTLVENLTFADAGFAHTATLGALAMASGLAKVTINNEADTVTIGTGFTNAIEVAYDAATSDVQTDTISASGSAAVLTVSGSAAAFAAADTFTGGTTTGDTFKIKADSNPTGAVFSSADTAFEKITIVASTAGTDTVKVTTGGMGAAGATLVINAAALTSASATFTLNASGETVANVSVTGGAGNDLITGGAMNDNISGGAGNDSITFASANFTLADTVAGADGDDTIIISDAATVVDADFTNVTSVKTLQAATATALTAVTLGTLAQAAGITAVKGVTTGALTAVTVGADYTSGTVTVTIGAGNVSVDTISASASAATLKVSVAGTDLSTTGIDVITGGTGTSDELSITGGAATLTAAKLATVTAMEKFTIAGTTTADFSITTNDANIASGKSLLIDGSLLTTGALTVDGGNETNGTFSLVGGTGNDSLLAGSGNDTISGGDGNDSLNGGTGDDSVSGGAGNDTITIAQAADYATGETGTDTLVVSAIGSGTYVLDLAATTDQLTTFNGASNSTTQSGFENADFTTVNGVVTATAAAAGSSITGGTVADSLTGAAGNDTLSGGVGNDTLTGGDGADSITGGAGTNRITVQLSSAGNWDDVVVGGSTAADTLVVTGAAISTRAIINLAVTGTSNITQDLIDVLDVSGITAYGVTATNGTNAVTVLGTEQADSISAGSGGDTISGGGGADTIVAGSGADSIAAGEGADTITMGANLTNGDTIVGGGGTDTMTITDDNGTTDLDGVSSVEVISITQTGTSAYVLSASKSLIAAGANLTVTQDAAFALKLDITNSTTTGTLTFTGNTTNDSVYGGSGADTLDGGAGADSILGGIGADSITAGTGADVITGGAGIDTILLGAAGDIDTLTYSESATANVDIVSVSGANIFTVGTDIVSFSVGDIANATTGTNQTLSNMVGADIGGALAAGAFTSQDVAVDGSAALADLTNMIVFSSITSTSFATAIGTAALTATTGPNTAGLSATEGVAAVWYDLTNTQAVYGYIVDSAVNGTELTSADTFVEVVRIGMASGNYAAANLDLSLSAF